VGLKEDLTVADERIAQSYESSYNVALKREEALRENLGRITAVSQTANTSSVELRELEREAETFRALYNNFLQRYQEAVQEQSFPITDARVITQAKPPKDASYPKIPLVVALSMVLGLAAGAGIGAIREYRDRFFRVGQQIRNELGLEYLGSLTRIDRRPDTPQSDAQVPGLWLPDPLNVVLALAGLLLAGPLLEVSLLDRWIGAVAGGLVLAGIAAAYRRVRGSVANVRADVVRSLNMVEPTAQQMLNHAPSRAVRHCTQYFGHAPACRGAAQSVASA